MTETLQQRVLAAYGGPERWRESNAVEATLSAGGLLFRWKRRRGYPRLEITASVHEPQIRMRHFEQPQLVGILEGHDVRVEDESGRTIEARPNARDPFPYGRRLLYWDRLDMVYFLGYALWNYLTLPALLLREDVAWRQTSDTVLEARFPREIPTHCPVARFHFHPDSALLHEYDYTAEPFGGWAVAAHMITEHDASDGVTFTSKRRVKPRYPGKKGGPMPFPLLIWADVHEHRLV